MTAKDIIERLGGRWELAARLALSAAAVWRWEHDDWIPTKHHAALIQAAKAAGKRLRAADFPAPKAAQTAAE